MSVSIRRIVANDKSAWLKLWTGPKSYLEFYNATIPQEASETTFDRFLDEKEPVFSCVAVEDSTGNVIGFANYIMHRSTWTIGNSMYLNDLFVAADCRLHGVGRKLIEFVYAEADKNNCEKTYWLTAMDNHRAQLLYTKLAKSTGLIQYKR